MPDDLTRLTIGEAGLKLRKREVSSVELTRAAFDRIRATDDRVHAFLTLTEDLALEQAKRADERIAKGEGTDRKSVV